MSNKSEIVWKAVVTTEFEVLSLVFKEWLRRTIKILSEYLVCRLRFELGTSQMQSGSATTCDVLCSVKHWTSVCVPLNSLAAFSGIWHRWLCVCRRQLTPSLLMSYIHGAPCKVKNFNVVYIWTYVWEHWKLSLSICCTMFQHWTNAESYPVGHLCVNTLLATKVTLITDGI
jgi:hypothetical protein